MTLDSMNENEEDCFAPPAEQAPEVLAESIPYAAPIDTKKLILDANYFVIQTALAFDRLKESFYIREDLQNTIIQSFGNLNAIVKLIAFDHGDIKGSELNPANQNGG